jgi:predicted DNA binding CopG/RHH family protein
MKKTSKKAAKKAPARSADKAKDRPEADDTAPWESKKLGADPKHAKRVSPELEREMNAVIDEATGLKAISLRLPGQLIDALKTVAKEVGLGYQPYIRMILTDHVKHPRKRISKAV